MESGKYPVLDFKYMQRAITIVVPVYNEEKDLPLNIPKLYFFLKDKMASYRWEVVIADNASIDKTPEVGKKLAQKEGIRYLRIPQKGRGRALKAAWNVSKSDILAYMDVDLSSDLSFFPKLVGALEAGADVAIGSRLVAGSKVYGRPLLREIMSRGYSLLFRVVFLTSFNDAQCGFKAVRKEVWDKISPAVTDTGWFFDSELLIIADKAGFDIAEIPITWHDDPASTVKVAKTAWGDIKGLIRLFITRPWKSLR